MLVARWLRAASGDAPSVLLPRWLHTPPPHPPPPVRLPPALATALETAVADFRPRQLRAAAAGLLTDLRRRSRSAARGGVAVVEADDESDDEMADLLADDDGDENDATSPPTWLDQRRRASAQQPRRAAPPPTYTTPAAAAAYAAIRSPATYAATLHALTAVRAAAPAFQPATLLDFGAGAAAATAAATTIFSASLTAATAVERSDAMARVGVAVLDAWRRAGGDAPGPPPVRWARRLPPSAVEATYDLVLAAYAVGEHGSPAAAAPPLRALWRRVAPGGVLVVLEPATPSGGAVVAAARSLTLASRTPSHILAPCLHDRPCPLPADRVCRARQRLLRPRLAAAVTPGPGRGPPPHQDERFSYVAVRKAGREESGDKAGEQASNRPAARLVGPPRRRARHVLLATCTAAGALETVTVTKGGSGGLYRAARKAAWGGVWPPPVEGGDLSPSSGSESDDGEASTSNSSSSSSSSEESD